MHENLSIVSALSKVKFKSVPGNCALFTSLLPGSAISTDPVLLNDNDDYNSDTDVRFKLGDLTNNDTNGDGDPDDPTVVPLGSFSSIELQKAGEQEDLDGESRLVDAPALRLALPHVPPQ